MGKRTGPHAEVDRPGKSRLIGTSKTVSSYLAMIRVPFPIPELVEFFNELLKSAVGKVPGGSSIGLNQLNIL
jgi:hypothetical protein